MSVLGRRRPARGTSPSASVYGSSFVRIVHRLLAEACKTLPRTLSTEEEPSITGMVVQRMNAFLEARNAPRWCGRLSVHDDPPLNVGSALGKRRPRIDIEVESVVGRPRPRFHFEAKRLYRSQSASDYTGADGLGSFISERYGRSHSAGGMLAYVQTDTVDVWISKIAARLDADRTSTGLAARGPVWEAFEPPDHALPSFRSQHRRKSGPIILFHTFLVCY